MKAKVSVGKCPVDGVRLSTHPRCGFCAIFFGVGHLEAAAGHVDGKPICGHCLAVHRRWPERLVAGQFIPTTEPVVSNPVIADVNVPDRAKHCARCGELIPITEWPQFHECEGKTGLKAKKGRSHDPN